jgi:hypothetical protein
MPDRPCEYCERGHGADAGGYYDSKACEARWLRKEIEKAERAGKPEAEIQGLETRLERAEYVGD